MDPERWLVLGVRLKEADKAPEVSETLIELGGLGVIEQDDVLTTYVRPPDDVESWLGHAGSVLADVLDGAAFELEWRWEANEDWALAWRRGLRSRRVGERFVVTPSWALPDAGPNDLVLVIDPEMAFGTAEHASTRGVLRLLERAVRPGNRVLDVGTGSGILAIGARAVGAASVLAVEMDGDALDSTRRNLRRNAVEDGIEVVHAVVDNDFLLRQRSGFDVIVANVLSSVLVPLLAGFRAAVRGEGRLILGGMLEEEADGVRQAAEAAGWCLQQEDVEDGWWSVLFQPCSERPPAAPVE
jgi:ribosomal protein L11 methyltransferase